MRLSQVVGGTSTVAVAVGGEKLPVVYAVGAFTPALEDQLNTLANGQGERPGREFCELLSHVLVSWELDEDEQGDEATEGTKMVATTPDRLMDLPAKFLSDCLLAISEDMRPGEADGSSSVGSSPAASSGSSPTGIGSSPQPDISASPRGTLQPVR